MLWKQASSDHVLGDTNTVVNQLTLAGEEERQPCFALASSLAWLAVFLKGTCPYMLLTQNTEGCACTELPQR